MGASRQFRTGARVLVAAGLCLLVAGCGGGVDPGEARVCRQVVAALHIGADRITIDRATPASGVSRTRGGVRESGVAITYSVARTNGRTRRGGIVCRFEAGHDPASAASHLRVVDTPRGRLASARIYMLKRYWLETPDALAADPEPVAGASTAIPLPRTAAIAVQNGLAALPQIAIYAVLSAAYALVYGLAGRANLAFGDLAAMGGYGALVGLVAAGGAQRGAIALLLALALAVWCAGAIAAWFGRRVFLPVRRDLGQAPLIASVALAVTIAEATRLLQGDKAHAVPPLLSEPVAVVRAGDYVATTTPMSLLVAAFGGAAAMGVLALVARTPFGRRWRAAGDDPCTAALLGIDVARLAFETCALAGALAGIAGALSAVQFGGVAQGTGLVLGLKALMAAILGGLGSLPGAVTAAILIGVFETVWAALVSIEHRDAALFIVLTVLLVLRPGGILGRPELEPRR